MTSGVFMGTKLCAYAGILPGYGTAGIWNCRDMELRKQYLLLIAVRNSSKSIWQAHTIPSDNQYLFSWGERIKEMYVHQSHCNSTKMGIAASRPPLECSPSEQACFATPASYDRQFVIKRACKMRRLVSYEKGAEYPISNKEFPISKEELERQDQTVFLHHWKLLVEHQTAQINPISYKNTKAWHESD